MNKKTKTINYVDNASLLEVLKEYKRQVKESKENGTPKPAIPEYVGNALLQISNGLANRANFMNYSWKEEMVLDGIENCLKYIDNFEPIKEVDPDTGKITYNNPFAYFTQIIWFSFVRRIKNEKKQQYIKHKNLYNLLTEYSLDEHNNITISGTGKNQKELQWNDPSFDIIDQFEKSIVEKKKKTKKEGIEKYILPTEENDE